MMTFTKSLMGLALATSLLIGTSQSAHAQASQHGIAAVVNSDIITTHDLRQRVLFMLATTGAERTEESLSRLQRQAMRNLIDEHLQMQEAEKYEQSIADEEVNQSVGRLIGRNGLDPNEVIGRISRVSALLKFTLRRQKKLAEWTVLYRAQML